MTRAIFVSVFALVLSALATGQTEKSTTNSEVIVGYVDKNLSAGDRLQTESLVSATPSDRAVFPSSVTSTDRVFVDATIFRKDRPLKLALVETASGRSSLFVDLNQDGLFQSNEQFVFENPDSVLLVMVPLTDSAFPFYPIKFKLLVQAAGEVKEGQRTLLRSPFAFVRAWAVVGGRKTLLKYMFTWDKDIAYPDYGWIGMDVNGDGRIEETSNSEEYTFANDESVIFHVAGYDVSTSSLDVKSGRVLLVKHASADNRRIVLRTGQSIPDFTFTDVDGKSHHFSEFRGRYVLLDFWGTWCTPCRQELPVIEKAFEQYRSRNFLVLGMNDDRDVNKLRALLREKGVTFLQSTGDEGNDLVHKRFRVDSFPSEVLIDPSGSIIEMQGGALRGEKLGAALDKLLP